MDKKIAIEAAAAGLAAQLDRTTAAARDAGAAASDPENKAENKYDTRGLESSYLAAGQAEQVRELSEALAQFTPSAFPDCAEVKAGALVEVELAGSREYFLLAPAGGGLVLEVEGEELTVLAPGVPLRDALAALSPGARLASPPLQILSVS